MACRYGQLCGSRGHARKMRLAALQWSAARFYALALDQRRYAGRQPGENGGTYPPVNLPRGQAFLASPRVTRHIHTIATTIKAGAT